MINVIQVKLVVLDWNFGLLLGVLVSCWMQQVSLCKIFGVVGLFRGKVDTSITKSQRSRA